MTPTAFAERTASELNSMKIPNRQPWLSIWKARAQMRRDWLERVLTAQPSTARARYFRNLAVTRALRSVEQGKSWIDAYSTHLTDVDEMLREAAGPINYAAEKGNLGE